MGNDIDIFVLLCGVFIVFFHNNDPNTPGAHPRQYHLYTEHLCCLARLDQLLGLVTDRKHRWSHHHLSESVLMYSPMSNVNNNRQTYNRIYTVFFGSGSCLPRLLLTSQNFSEQKYISNRWFKPGPFICFVRFVYLVHNTHISRSSLYSIKLLFF